MNNIVIVLLRKQLKNYNIISFLMYYLFFFYMVESSDVYI